MALDRKAGFFWSRRFNLYSGYMPGITLSPIGVLHCDLKTREQTPKNFDESPYEGTIEIYSEFIEGLDGIQKGDTIVVLFWLDRSDRTVLKVHPRGDASRPKRGVFATRSPDRPNPLGISELLVENIKDNKISVKNIDILDATPVIDIKKKISRSKA